MVVGGRELIDTLWTVNENERIVEFEEKPELIDTLWNVNSYLCQTNIHQLIELIDTLWNVNHLQRQNERYKKSN